MHVIIREDNIFGTKFRNAAEMPQVIKPVTCDIFCVVVDNYGDIGVCWRLARQLAYEHHVVVRLWVNDLHSFQRLCPEVNASLEQQYCRGVEVMHWKDESFHNLAQSSPCGQKSGGDVATADLVIEAFACKLPECYVVAMSENNQRSVWINLEYLSAETWIESCHKLPSPHASLPLVKYFFFPGFTPKTGGLLLEQGLLQRRDSFQQDEKKQGNFWQSIGLEMPAAEVLKVSLFAYENASLHDLFDTWKSGRQKVLCLVPEGPIQLQVKQYFKMVTRNLSRQDDSFRSNTDSQKHRIVDYTNGNLHVRILPFVEQEKYDELLWACDINFVRGEDSCVRAQWAGKPFVWHIYPQHDGVHLKKLRDFMALYCTGLQTEATRLLHAFWYAWNGRREFGQSNLSGTGQAWNDFCEHRTIFQQHARGWANQLSGNSLAINLLDFFKEIESHQYRNEKLDF